MQFWQNLGLNYHDLKRLPLRKFCEYVVSLERAATKQKPGVNPHDPDVIGW